MALVQCAECGEEISDQAKACPKCGAPQAKKSGGCLPVLLGLIAVAIVAFIVLGAIGSNSGSGSGKPAYTGHFRLKDGTEYVMEETPSPIGGACAGWNTVSIQKTGSPVSGIRDLMCWRRTGTTIETQDRYGGNLKSSDEWLISD